MAQSDETIYIPASTKDMKIQHWPFLLELQKFKATEEGGDDKEPTIGEMARMCSMFTGVHIKKMRRYAPRDCKNLFYQICARFRSHEPEPIPLELEYPNPEYNQKAAKEAIRNKSTYDVPETFIYTFREDFSKLPIDWFIDVDEADFNEEPIDIMAFCYIEKGLTYGEVDQHENIINPRARRNAIFREHVPLNLFMDIQGFFLLKWNVLEKLSTLRISQIETDSKSKK